MQRLGVWVLAASLLAVRASSGTIAQSAPPPSAERVAFNRLSDALTGRWLCEIRELEPSGAVKWSDQQIRVFSRAFLGNAIEERAYKAPRLESADNFGLQILLLQRPGSRVTHYGIWPGGDARVLVVEGTLRADGSGFDGTMLATDAAGKEDRRRVAMDLIDASRHAYRIYRKGPDGTEYLQEELVYTRA